MPQTTPEPDAATGFSSTEPAGAVAMAPSMAGKTPEQIAKEAKIEALMKEEHLIYCGPQADPTYLWTPVVAIATFLLIALLVKNGKRTNTLLAIFLLVPIPAIWSLCAALEGLMQTCHVIEQSGTDPDPASLFGAFAETLNIVRYGTLFSLPAGAVAIVYAIVRFRQPVATFTIRRSRAPRA